MKSIAMIVLAGSALMMAGSAYAVTPSHVAHRSGHVHHAAHQQAKPAEPQPSTGPAVIPDPEIYDKVL